MRLSLRALTFGCPQASPDESALLIISEVVSALIARPPKSEGWLKNRELELKARGVDPEAYDSQPAGEK